MICNDVYTCMYLSLSMCVCYHPNILNNDIHIYIYIIQKYQNMFDGIRFLAKKICGVITTQLTWITYKVRPRSVISVGKNPINTIVSS